MLPEDTLPGLKIGRLFMDMYSMVFGLISVIISI